jgi:hypothetical protein
LQEAGEDCIIWSFVTYVSPNIIRVIKLRRMRLAGCVTRVEKMRNGYNILIGKPEEKIPFARPSRRWEDNIRMDLREIGWEEGCEQDSYSSG